MKYFADWAEKGHEQMVADFGHDCVPDEDVVFASYIYADYSGAAYVLFERDGKLFEINGSHCSCHGLSEAGICEGGSQWVPEETSWQAIANVRYGPSGLDQLADATLRALCVKHGYTPVWKVD